MEISEGHLSSLRRNPAFLRLYSTRIIAQCGDGVFQAGLTGSILFNPDRQTSALTVAAGFAVLLLPYSAVGPFAGVFLDRWPRRNTLVVVSLLRACLIPLVATAVWENAQAVAFLLPAFLCISVSRFFLSGLSAALPRTVPESHLITANAVSTTSGTIAYSVGIGLAIFLQVIAGADNHSYSLITLVAAVLYASAGAVAWGFARLALGPDDVSTPRLRIGGDLRVVVKGMMEGVKHLLQRRQAAAMVTAISLQRCLYGMFTITLLLLYRSPLRPFDGFPVGPVGLGETVVAAALGALLAAVLTPVISRRITPRTWFVFLLGLTAVLATALGVTFLPPALTAAAFVVAVAAQGTKIVADSTVQDQCDDQFIGRIFAVYDMTFNVCLVIGLLAGALLLPLNGRSVPVIVATGIGYAVLAGFFIRAPRSRPSSTIPRRPRRGRVDRDRDALL